MVKKLSQRKHGKLVTEKFSEAVKPLQHLTQEQLEKAKADFKIRQADLDSAPAHIKVIRRLGVVDAQRGYSDVEIAELIEAEELISREQRSPGDFVSAKVFSAAQANGDGKNETYDHEEIIQEALRIGYFELKPHSRNRRKKRLEIVNNLRLRHQNQATSDDSWNRLMSRILDKLDI